MSSAHTPVELVLGTAQLGLAYGVANRTGQPSQQEANLFLRAAVNAGVRWIDTAAAYGSSEQRIGAALPGSPRVRISTKLSPLDQLDESASPGEIRWAARESVRRSCARLKVDRLEVLMLHRAAHLTAAGGAIWRSVKELRDEGVVYDLGVSVYAPDEAMRAIADHDIRHIQLPFNALDWRWRESGVIQALADRPGITVHARSALLQGLLAAGPGAYWPQIEGIDPHDMTARLIRIARDLGRDSAADLCLAYVRAQDWIDGVVVGMENVQQLALNLALFKRPALAEEEIEHVDAELPRASARLLDPSLWAKAA